MTNSGHDRVGSLIVAPEDTSRPILDEFVRRARRLADRHGSDDIGALAWRTGDGLAERKPWLADGLMAGEMPGTARVDGRRLVAGLRQAFRSRGGGECRGRARLVVERERVRGVVVGQRRCATSTVISAIGVWADQGLSQLAPLRVRAVRGELVHLRPDDAGDQAVVTTTESTYAVTFPDRRIVVGTTSEEGGVRRLAPTAGGVQTVLNDAIRWGPGLRYAPIIDIRVGFRPVSVDGLPILGADRRVGGLYHAAGLGRWGLTIGPFVGAESARLALGCGWDMALDAINVDRFSRGFG